MSSKTAFIGLGVMGYPMAGHLKKAGHQVTIYNRTASKAEQWVQEYGGMKASTPADAAKEADFVMACVGNDDDLREITCGTNGAFSGMSQGSVFIDHTTVSAKVTRELSENAAEQGFSFLDAPISGGQAGAENGMLTVMVGGDPTAFERAQPVMDAYSRMIKLLGPSGYGQMTKMVNQICIAGLVQALAEAMNFGQRAGLDMDKVLDTISKGSAGSWQMENRGRTMVAGKFDFGFAVDWARKDFGICLAEAHRLGTRLPVTALVDQFYAQVQARGGGRWDTSSLMHLLAKD